MEDHTIRLNFYYTTLRNIEVQLWQLAQDIHRRPQGGIQSDTVGNPKGNEQCCVIRLRSRNMLKNKNEEREVDKNILLKKYNVMKKESEVNNKDRVKPHKEVSLGEEDVIDDKIDKESKSSTQVRRKNRIPKFVELSRFYSSSTISISFQRKES